MRVAFLFSYRFTKEGTMLAHLDNRIWRMYTSRVPP